MNRQQFFTDIAARLTTQELSYVQKAYWLVNRDCLTLSKEIPMFDVVTGLMLSRAKQKEEQYYATVAAAGRAPRIIKSCDRIDNLADFDQWEDARREKYNRETRTYVLPIARATDTRMAEEIESRLMKERAV